MGRWRSEIHDYFPNTGSEGEMDQDYAFRDTGKEERMVMRQELAELGEKMAKIDRVKKRHGF